VGELGPELFDYRAHLVADVIDPLDLARA